MSIEDSVHIPKIVTINQRGFDGEKIRTNTNSFLGRIWVWIRSGVWLSKKEFQNKIAKGILENLITNSHPINP